MNVYDFDHTIYQGDCTLDFWRFCIQKYPAVLRALPRTLVMSVGFLFGKCSRETFKETFYGFLRYVPDIEVNVQKFWKIHIHKCMSWYFTQKSPDDLIISASPDFLISEICDRLGVQWIASPVDTKTGKLLGANCRGEEKVQRFFQRYPGVEVMSFYSDSKSDEPLAILAKCAFRVKRGKIINWFS